MPDNLEIHNEKPVKTRKSCAQLHNQLPNKY